MKNVLLIGGEGYIGNVVSEHLLDAGYGVISYDLLLYKNNLCVLNHCNHKNYSFIYGDINDTSKLEGALRGVDAVVMLAGLVGDPITKKYPEASALINDSGVRNVIDVCAKASIEKLIFISTCSNYGLIENDEKADENHDLSPLSLYAKSKVGAEKAILSLKGKTGINPTILRFATAFGISPRMRFDLTVSEFTRELAIGNELLVFDADTWRPYCHVRDFARLIEVVLEADSGKVAFEVFNAGGDINNATKQMIVDKILKNIPSGVVKYQDHGSDPRNYKVDFSKVKNTLGFEPSYSIDDGVVELVELIHKNIFKNVDENKNFHGNYSIDYRTN